MIGIPTVETSGIGGMQTSANIEDVYQGDKKIEENIKNLQIKVDVSALKASKLYDNKNNIINSFQHEKKHVDDIKTQKGLYIKQERGIREQRAISYQRSTSSWEKTTSEFKKAVEEYEKRINQQ